MLKEVFLSKLLSGKNQKSGGGNNANAPLSAAHSSLVTHLKLSPVEFRRGAG